MMSELGFTQNSLRDFLEEKFQRVRKVTEDICKPLTTEDCLLSTTEDTSPPKWHLAHTTWFFERFILRQQGRDFPTFNPTFNYLFNSYYKSLGAHLPKKDRSLLSRPSLEEVHEYRKSINGHVLKLIQECDEIQFSNIKPILELGLNHEQQHQELLLMDIKQNFFRQSLNLVYSNSKISIPTQSVSTKPSPTDWKSYAGGLNEIGYAGDEFHYDNESGKHRVWIESFELASNLVTNAEYLEFMTAKGYEDAKYWLSDGWDCIQSNGWQSPHYWVKEANDWKVMGLHGLKNLNLSAPVAHVSYYEAQAYAQFRKARLPTEAEWEFVASTQAVRGHFLNLNQLEPQVSKRIEPEAHTDLHGNLWEWTQSAYLPYPGFVPFLDDLGEYNSKFMCNQFVLRGGSCITPLDHYRTTYRNFYYPHMRWQYCGFRLARDGSNT